MPAQPQPTDLLRAWIARHASDDGLAWLTKQAQQIQDGAPTRTFFLAFSGVPRYLGKADLDLSADDLRAAAAARTGWTPAAWSVDQAGRALLLLALPTDDRERYEQTVRRVFQMADVGEAVALYQSLPLLPLPDVHHWQAVEGLRTNIKPVFEAIALHNPFPVEHFDEDAWNQMVLKAVFIGTDLHAIQGLGRRANAKLARMLADYAHERWAAGRAVTPALWRPVGPHAEGALVDDLARVLRSGTEPERRAAALALAASPDPRAAEVLAEAPELQAAVERGEIEWSET